MPTDHILDRPNDWTQTFWGTAGIQFASRLPYAPIQGEGPKRIVPWFILIRGAINGLELGCALSLHDPDLGKSILERDCAVISPYLGEVSENWESVYEPIIQDLHSRISACGDEFPSYRNMFPESGPNLIQPAASRIIARQVFRGLILPLISEEVAEQILISGTEESEPLASSWYFDESSMKSMPIPELLTLVKQHAASMYKEWTEIPGTGSSETNAGTANQVIPDLPDRLRSSSGSDFDAATPLSREAVDLVRMERYDEALIRFERIASLFPDWKLLSDYPGDITQAGVLADPLLRSLLADTLNQIGLVSARLESLPLAPWAQQLGYFTLARRLRPDEPEDPDILLLQGTSIRSLHPKRALSTITRALELKPNDPDILYERVLTRLELGHHKKALEDVSRILELNPDHIASLCFRGDVYMREGLYDEAVENYERGLEIEPDNPDVLYAHAVGLMSISSYAEALDELDRVMELTDIDRLRDDLFYWWRSSALLHLRRHEEAVIDCEAYMSGNPDDLDGQRLLDNLKTLTDGSDADRGSKSLYVRPPQLLFGRWGVSDSALLAFSTWDRIWGEDRLPFLNQQLELEPDDRMFEEWALLVNRGDELLWEGSKEEALNDFSRALELRPDNAYIWAFRGMALEYLDRLDEALIEYNRAIDLQPDMREKLGMNPDPSVEESSG